MPEVSLNVEVSPSVSYDVETGLWTVPQGWTYRGNGVTVVIPVGFSTDLSSIPRYLWWLIAPFELSIEAPLVHDWSYRGNAVQTVLGTTYLSKLDTDKLFYKIMLDEGVPLWRRKLAYAGVRLCGANSWKGLT